MVVVSNGFHKMHLTIAAREASDRGLLSLAITGAYPTAPVRRLIQRLGAERIGRVARLLERDEAIPRERLHPLFLPELLDEAARPLERTALTRDAYPHLNVAASRLYGRIAARKLRLADHARILHFRASFGGASINLARDLGMTVLCDHALAHPSVLDRAGRQPRRVEGSDAGRARPLPTPTARRPVGARDSRRHRAVGCRAR